MEGDVLDRDCLFVALTRPQMLGGVTYRMFVGNVVLVAELFLLTKSYAVLLVGGLVHAIACLVCLHDPRLFDVWVMHIRRCPAGRNRAFWKRNSYLP